MVRLDPFSGGQRRLENRTDLLAGDGAGGRVEGLPVGPAFAANGTEHGEPDARALQRGTRELSHIAFTPHIRSIGGAESTAEQYVPRRESTPARPIRPISSDRRVGPAGLEPTTSAL